MRNHTGYDIISNAHEEVGYPIPEGLNSVGYLPQHEYDLTLVSRTIRRLCLIIIVGSQASARAVFGIGQPMISPTPYASLCRGYVLSELLDHAPNYAPRVPVVLPYDGQFVFRETNKSCGARPGPDEWCGFLDLTHQHGPACRIGPPYVYAVDVHSPIEKIFEIIDTAINTPIEP